MTTTVFFDHNHQTGTDEIWPDGLCTPYRLTLAITSHAKHTGPRDNSQR